MEYTTPRTIDEALALLAKHGEDARVIAGGTAVVPLMKQRLLAPELLLALSRVSELRGVWQQGGALRLGACVSQREAERAELVRTHVPVLAETFQQVASVRIRNAATVGGSLAHADPNQDPPVTLLALAARVRLRSAGRGLREVPIEAFFRDYYETVRAADELLVEIEVPLPPARSGSSYLKFLPRSHDDYATVSAAVWMDADPQSGVCRDCRIALGCVGPTPLRVRAAEDMLRGQPPSEALLREVAEAARSCADPLDDTRGSAEYKRDMTAVFARRALESAWQRARTGAGA